MILGFSQHDFSELRSVIHHTRPDVSESSSLFPVWRYPYHAPLGKAKRPSGRAPAERVAELVLRRRLRLKWAEGYGPRFHYHYLLGAAGFPRKVDSQSC